MGYWIWPVAIASGVVILTLSLVWAASRGVSLGKKLKPFAEHVANFQKSAEQYPEAVKFYSELAKSQEKPAKKPKRRKG
jgi:hypothetical protein